ncbi:carboxymuconolactone decarboxylase family protein [Hyphomonas sp.]|uniref:carboxymuconolactone decarboxylase family protein n=1 Tax=Hyphomonas sp. TaxID=87 RepID=UPI003F723F5A
MTNIPYPDVEGLEGRTKRIVDVSPKINIIKVMAHAPGNVESVLRLSDSVLNRGSLDPVTRQVALIRMCTVVGSDYERILLESVSLGVGLSEQLILAAREGSCSEMLTLHQKMAARLGEELAVSPRPTPDTFEHFRRTLPVREFVELVQAIGFYLMQTRLIETFDISPEEPPVDLSVRPDPDNEDLRAWREGRG